MVGGERKADGERRECEEGGRKGGAVRAMRKDRQLGSGMRAR